MVLEITVNRCTECSTNVEYHSRELWKGEFYPRDRATNHSFADEHRLTVHWHSYMMRLNRMLWVIF